MMFEMPQNLVIFPRISTSNMIQSIPNTPGSKFCLTKSYGKIIGPFNHILGIRDTQGKNALEFQKFAGKQVTKDSPSQHLLIHNVRCTDALSHPIHFLFLETLYLSKHLEYKGPRTKSMLWLLLCSTDSLDCLVTEYRCETSHFTIFQSRMKHLQNLAGLEFSSQKAATSICNLFGILMFFTFQPHLKH